MRQSFPRTSGLTKGYAVDQVEAFLDRVVDGQLAAQDVRAVAFDLVRGGFEVEAVDEHLDQLEDELASRERESELAQLGRKGLWDRASSQAQVLRGRVRRPHGDRFPRAGTLQPAYDVSDVDELCDLVGDFFDGSGSLRAADVRAAVFRTRRGSRGYREDSVDRFFDRVIDVMNQVG